MSHVRRFDHVGRTVADLDAVTAFFVALGLEVEGRTFVKGEFLDTVCGIPGSRMEIGRPGPCWRGIGPAVGAALYLRLRWWLCGVCRGGAWSRRPRLRC
jgi:catechol 2,3-dioxygenase-like lactoylglutathione lyase family enzyme